MPQLLIELFSEEIPARMQARAEADLLKALAQKLEAAGLTAQSARAFSSPRHLGAILEGVPAKAEDVSEERKGPRVGAPEAAIAGFLRGAGLASIDEAAIVSDKKGDFYVAHIARSGRAAPDILRDVIPEILRAFPWPKSMRSGVSDLTWVRPLHNILVLFDGAHVRIDIDGLASEHATFGHRFHAPGAIKPIDGADHCARLREAKVLVDREERKAIIREGAARLCAARGLDLVEDGGLLEEVTGLVEWPVPLLGRMDEAFLDLPAEIIRLTMRTHQKYFAVRDPNTQRLAPYFIIIANIEAKDGGGAIAAGNARVLSARLNDARFFWEADKKTPLYTDERKAKLEKIIFHQKLGSVWEKVSRVRALAKELCAVTGADPALVDRAALLCKMDLVTESVGEFPELQGQIGRQLAAIYDEPESIAIAIEDHYRPLGPGDRAPTAPVAVTLALADKLDTLAGFWAIDEKPTGSSDPYALRRAALGIVRTILSSSYRIPLGRIETLNRSTAIIHEGFLRKALWRFLIKEENGERRLGTLEGGLNTDLLTFLAERLKVQLREQGRRHDLVDAVFALGDDDLVRIVARVEALSDFLKTEDGANLLASYKRAANILAAEEKKGRGLAPAEIDAGLDAALLSQDAEKALYGALAKAKPAAEDASRREDFAAAMAALAALRAPVDRFFDAVLVNDENPRIRTNRMLLLAEITGALHAVADFSKIDG